MMPGVPEVARTATCGMVRPRCLPRSISPRGSSSANATSVTGRPSSWTSSKRSMLKSPKGSISISSNYATHKTPKIKAWLARRPDYHVHFTPTSASWIKQVERWFAELTRKRLRELFIPPSGNSEPISVPSSIGTIKIPGPSNGPNLPTKSWLQFNASATKRRGHYAANFKFT